MVTNVEKIGELVCEAAYERFVECDAGNDFCIQHVGTNAVFGGTNRVIWSVEGGFSPDRSYCTSRFLQAWDVLYGGNQ